MKFGVKAGKLSNGFELDKGKIIHAIDTESDLYFQLALCGERPKIQWAQRDVTGHEVSCKKCLKKLNILKNISNN